MRRDRPGTAECCSAQEERRICQSGQLHGSTEPLNEISRIAEDSGGRRDMSLLQALDRIRGLWKGVGRVERRSEIKGFNGVGTKPIVHRPQGASGKFLGEEEG